MTQPNDRDFEKLDEYAGNILDALDALEEWASDKNIDDLDEFFRSLDSDMQY